MFIKIEKIEKRFCRSKKVKEMAKGKWTAIIFLKSGFYNLNQLR